MKFRATPTAALLTGAWTAFGFTTQEAFFPAGELSATVDNIVLLSMVAVFFIVPVLFFVIGKEHLKFGFRYSFSKEHLSAVPYVALRMFLWFIGAGVFGVAYGYLCYSVLQP